MYKLDRGVMHACHAGGLVHSLEGWMHHEAGAIGVDWIDIVWKAALKQTRPFGSPVVPDEYGSATTSEKCMTFSYADSSLSILESADIMIWIGLRGHQRPCLRRFSSADSSSEKCMTFSRTGTASSMTILESLSGLGERR